MQKMIDENMAKKWRKEVFKMGAMLGSFYVLSMYLFYYGGREIYLDSNLSNLTYLLTVIGLYMGMLRCSKIPLKFNILKLFLSGILILVISVFLKVLFAMLLYGIFSPELGQGYENYLFEKISEFYVDMGNRTFYNKDMMKAMLNPVTIAIMEGINLLLSGGILVVLIAAFMTISYKIKIRKID